MLFLYPSEGRVMLLLFWTDGSNLLVFNPYAEDCWLCTQSRDLTVLHLRVKTCWLFTPNSEDLLIRYAPEGEDLLILQEDLLVLYLWWRAGSVPTWEWRPAGSVSYFPPENEDLLVGTGGADHLAPLRAVEGDLLLAEVRTVQQGPLLDRGACQ